MQVACRFARIRYFEAVVATCYCDQPSSHVKFALNNRGTVSSGGIGSGTYYAGWEIMKSISSMNKSITGHPRDPKLLHKYL